MIQFIKNIRRRRQRASFKFWDGQRERAADPMGAYRMLITHQNFDWEKDPTVIDALNSEDNDLRQFASECTDRTLAAVREVFGVKRFEDGGLTEAETIGLLADFVTFLGAVKKNSSTPPISSPPMESPSDKPTTPTTNSDCSSTNSESGSENPEKYCKESSPASPAPS